jgi:hypothetical protein
MTSNSIPLSPALAEALPESLDQIMSKDPQGYSDQDISRIITELRSHRERLANLAASGPAPRAPVSAKIKIDLSRKITAETAAELDDLGI